MKLILESILPFALILGCHFNDEKINDISIGELDSLTTKITQDTTVISGREKDSLTTKIPQFIIDTFSHNSTNWELLSNKKIQSQWKLEFFKQFNKASYIDSTIHIIEPDYELEIKYLGKVETLDKNFKFSVITNNATLGTSSMLSPRGHQSVAFIYNNQDSIVVYDLEMIDELPYLIKNNLLYFRNKNDSVALVFKHNLPPLLCIPKVGCY